MGTVVRLEKPAKAKATGAKPSRRRQRRSKTALVLGGGGVTGGVYEIGALRALDILAVNRTVNEFDVYVGTSGFTTTTNFAPCSTAMSTLVVERMPPSTSWRPLISTGR